MNIPIITVADCQTLH